MAQNDLERQLTQNQSLAVPDYLKDQQMEGLEHVTEEDVALPRLLITQQGSPQLNPAKPEYMEDLKSGDFFNSLTQQIYGRGPLVFSVLRGDPPRWMEFIPREQGGGIKDRNVPHGDPRTEWQPDGKPPIATKFYDFIIILHQFGGQLVALSFKSTGLKIARGLNGLMQARMKPIYTGTYSIDAPSTTNAKGSWFIPRVKNVGWVPQEMVATLKTMSDGLKHQVIDIDRPESRGGTADDGDTSFDPAAMEAPEAGDAEGM